MSETNLTKVALEANARMMEALADKAETMCSENITKIEHAKNEDKRIHKSGLWAIAFTLWASIMSVGSLMFMTSDIHALYGFHTLYGFYGFASIGFLILAFGGCVYMTRLKDKSTAQLAKVRKLEVENEELIESAKRNLALANTFRQCWTDPQKEIDMFNVFNAL